MSRRHLNLATIYSVPLVSDRAMSSKPTGHVIFFAVEAWGKFSIPKPLSSSDGFCFQDTPDPCEISLFG